MQWEDTQANFHLFKQDDESDSMALCFCTKWVQTVEASSGWRDDTSIPTSDIVWCISKVALIPEPTGVEGVWGCQQTAPVQWMMSNMRRCKRFAGRSVGRTLPPPGEQRQISLGVDQRASLAVTPCVVMRFVVLFFFLPGRKFRHASLFIEEGKKKLKWRAASEKHLTWEGRKTPRWPRHAACKSQ